MNESVFTHTDGEAQTDPADLGDQGVGTRLPEAPDPAADGGEGVEEYGVRLLVLGWCFWLILSWFVLFQRVGWNGAGFRLMLFAAMLGVMGGWPALRLSQATVAVGREVTPKQWAWVTRRVFLDWLFLNLVFQAVMWPLRLAARWSWEQAIWIDASVAAWSLLAGLLIAWGRRADSGGVRALAMLACVGVVLAEPVLWWLGSVLVGDISGRMRVSPIQAMWGLSSPMARSTVYPWAQQVVAVGLAAVAGWVVLAGMMWMNGRRETRK